MSKRIQFQLACFVIIAGVVGLAVAMLHFIGAPWLQATGSVFAAIAGFVVLAGIGPFLSWFQERAEKEEGTYDETRAQIRREADGG